MERAKFLVFLAAFVLVGCIEIDLTTPVSLYPLYYPYSDSDKSRVIVPRLNGEWLDEKGNLWSFREEADSKSYKLVVEMSQNEVHVVVNLKTVIVQIPETYGTFFLDTSVDWDSLWDNDLSLCEVCEIKTAFLSSVLVEHNISVHLVSKFEINGDILNIYPLNPDFWKPKVKWFNKVAGSDNLGDVIDNTLVFKDRSYRLRQFIEEYRETEKAFSEPIKLQRKY